MDVSGQWAVGSVVYVSVQFLYFGQKFKDMGTVK